MKKKMVTLLGVSFYSYIFLTEILKQNLQQLEPFGIKKELIKILAEEIQERVENVYPYVRLPLS